MHKSLIATLGFVLLLSLAIGQQPSADLLLLNGKIFTSDSAHPYVLLAEFGAQWRSRAFWRSLANLGIPLGALAASGVMLVMSRSFATTGWRIAMRLSVVIVIPALLARYKLADSPLFKRLKQGEQLAALPSFGVFKRHAGPSFSSLLLSRS